MTPVRLVTMQRLASLLLFAGLSGTATAAINGLGVEPMRLELEGLPGQSKTASFVIDAPPSDEQNPVRGRILVRLADWSLDEDASVSYHEPGTLPASAARWITYSPSDFGVSSGQRRAVRVTAEIPLGTLPGVYTAALFVEERSPSESVSSGEYRFLFRFRYVVTVYVVVPPVTRQGELVNIELQEAEGGSRRLVASLKNIGRSEEHTSDPVTATSRMPSSA
mgnify:CR=1 FL=1